MSNAQDINIWEMSDLRTPWCIYVVVTLGIAEHVVSGLNTIDDIAKAASCDKDVLQTVLGHLVSKGVFTEPSSGKFGLNEPARQLLDPVAKLSFDLDNLGGRFAHAWSTLLQFTRTGKPAYDQVFDLPFWEDLDAHPDLAATFDAIIGPTGHGIPDPEFQLKGGWRDIHTIVDVGGGTGAMLAEILRAKPYLEGILVDLPRTIAKSVDIFRSAGVNKRVKTVGQSFFDPLPMGGDLYLLRGVINDWPDNEAEKILARCAEAAQPHGRVVVLKSVGPDGARRELTIEMLLLGGKHRTLTEFKELALAASLEVVAAGQQTGGYYVVECEPRCDR